MKSEKAFDYPTMEGPAIYRIRVRGRLNADLSDRLEGMHIENLQRNDGKAESVLEGKSSRPGCVGRCSQPAIRTASSGDGRRLSRWLQRRIDEKPKRNLELIGEINHE